MGEREARALEREIYGEPEEARPDLAAVDRERRTMAADIERARQQDQQHNAMHLRAVARRERANGGPR